jgi:hypothetical protein
VAALTFLSVPLLSLKRKRFFWSIALANWVRVTEFAKSASFAKKVVITAMAAAANPLRQLLRACLA